MGLIGLVPFFSWVDLKKGTGLLVVDNQQLCGPIFVYLFSWNGCAFFVEIRLLKKDTGRKRSERESFAGSNPAGLLEYRFCICKRQIARHLSSLFYIVRKGAGLFDAYLHLSFDQLIFAP